MQQSIRDVITGELSLEYFAKRFGEGWKVASIEWSRDAGDVNLPLESATLLNEPATVPYGYRVTEGGTVQENPVEATVLLLILEQIVREKRIQEIASELNQQGYSTREGMPWNATDIFNLLPRLIEASPSLLKSEAWQRRRRTVHTVVPRTN